MKTTTIDKYCPRGWSKPIKFIFGRQPVLGELWTVRGSTYTVIESLNAGEALLDRPLNDSLFPGDLVEVKPPPPPKWMYAISLNLEVRPLRKDKKLAIWSLERLEEL